jgi:poly(hydroxyalkanoate) depolymerase family esterase
LQRHAAAGTGEWLSGLAIGAAGARRYKLFMPSQAKADGKPQSQADEALPLLVMLHGCGQDADSFALSTRMNRLAQQQRFAVLYPEQDRLAHPQGCWNWFDTRTGRAQAEVALIMKAIHQVETLYSINRDQVAVVGLSAGAGMAALLASSHPEKFQAVVMHSGVPPGTADSTLTALAAMRGHRKTLPMQPRAANEPPEVWPPLLVIHGESDAVVALDNGRAAAEAWAAAVGAVPSPPRIVQRGQRHPMTVTEFKQGRRLAATLVQVARLGHAWSGGAASHPFGDALGPDASRLVWAFVAKQMGR